MIVCELISENTTPQECHPEHSTLTHPNMYTPLAIISCRALRLIPTSLYTYLLQQSTVYRITSYTKYGRSGTSHTVFCPYISMYHTRERDKGGDLPVIIPAAGVRTPL